MIEDIPQGAWTILLTYWWAFAIIILAQWYITYHRHKLAHQKGGEATVKKKAKTKRGKKR